jgi:hypothetical protein
VKGTVIPHIHWEFVQKSISNIQTCENIPNISDKKSLKVLEG